MVIRALLEVSIEGLGQKHRTSIFPCQIFQVMQGVNREPGDPNYDLFRLALESTARRLYPNYANCDVGCQKEWVEYDRKEKSRVIGDLNQEEKEKLVKILEENPELKTILSLDVVNGKLAVTYEQQPYEIMSTMGKCKLQLM